MDEIKVLQFQDCILMKSFFNRPVPMTPQQEPGLNNDRTKIIQVYFDAISAMHTVVYEGPFFDPEE